MEELEDGTIILTKGDIYIRMHEIAKNFGFKDAFDYIENYYKAWLNRTYHDSHLDIGFMCLGGLLDETDELYIK